MLNPSGALSLFDVGSSAAHGERCTADVHVRGAGVLAMYCSEAPLRLAMNGAPVVFQYVASRCHLTVEVPPGKGLRSQVSIVF